MGISSDVPVLSISGQPMNEKKVPVHGSSYPDVFNLRKSILLLVQNQGSRQARPLASLSL